MNDLKKYKNKIRLMFFVSINKNIDLWSINDNDINSPMYGDVQLNIDKKKKCLYLYNGCQYIKILKYEFLFIPIDLKVWIYVNRLKKSFNKRIKEKINLTKIEMLKQGVSNIEKNFLKEIRKNKITKIENS